MVGLKTTHQLLNENNMSKNQKSNKEDKKKSILTPKEKKTAKKLKKESKEAKGLFDIWYEALNLIRFF